MLLHPETENWRRAACSGVGHTYPACVSRSPRAGRGPVQALLQSESPCSPGHLCQADGLQRCEDIPRSLRVVAAIVTLDEQEEPTPGGQLELGYVEQRMIKFRQTVERQHGEERSECRAEHGELERHGYEGRPAVIGTASLIDRIGDHGRIPLHEVSARATDNAP